MAVFSDLGLQPVLPSRVLQNALFTKWCFKSTRLWHLLGRTFEASLKYPCAYPTTSQASTLRGTFLGRPL